MEAQAANCTYSDATVEFVGSNWGFSPNNFYAKEGDRLCIKFSSLDSNKTLMVSGTPVYLNVSKNQTREQMIVLRKKGELTVTCNGCDLQINKAKIIVQSKQEFEAFQKKMDRFNSLQHRNRFPTSGY